MGRALLVGRRAVRLDAGAGAWQPPLTTTPLADAAIEARAREVLKAPYRRLLRPDPEAGFLARAPDLPGCMTDGATEEEALRILDDAMLVWAEAAIPAMLQDPP